MFDQNWIKEEKIIFFFVELNGWSKSFFCGSESQKRATFFIWLKYRITVVFAVVHFTVCFKKSFQYLQAYVKTGTNPKQIARVTRLRDYNVFQWLPNESNVTDAGEIYDVPYNIKNVLLNCYFWTCLTTARSLYTQNRGTRLLFPLVYIVMINNNFFYRVYIVYFCILPFWIFIIKKSEIWHGLSFC